ncbi:MAG UNVERIFIED_CONTAM: hypothetical protein LVR18_49970 [Planctomycetaceae bacterium]|jgi:hypothetical protein
MWSPQGEGEFYLLDLFAVEAAFRIEVSTSGLFVQVEGGILLKDLGRATAMGYFELSKQGIVVALDLKLDLPLLKTFGITLEGAVQLMINTTSTDRRIEPLTDKLLLEPIVVEAGDVDIKAEGMLVFSIPGTESELGRVSGVFSLDTSTDRTTIFAAGELQIGPRGLRAFEMTVLGVFAPG